MKFQPGDKVIVKHTNEEAEVVEIINKNMVMLEAKGVKFPAYIDQLDFPYFKQFSEKKLFPEKKKEKTFIDEIRKDKNAEKKVVDGVWLTFIAVIATDEFGDDLVEELKVHLINRTETGYKFIYQLNFFGKSEFSLNNEINPFQDFYLHDIPFEDLNDSPAFSFEFTLLKPDKKKSGHYETSLKLKPKQLFNRIEEIRKKGESTFSYKLFDNYPDKIHEDDYDLDILANKGYKVYDASKARQNLEPAKHEIDLHIERLTPDHENLSNFEKLTLQLKVFEKYLDLAIAHHQPSMIAIHGVGSGKLRDEIHEILRLRREVKSFINQYHPAYGFGATEIFFQTP